MLRRQLMWPTWLPEYGLSSAYHLWSPNLKYMLGFIAYVWKALALFSIKDNFLSQAQNSICQCQWTKGRGNLFMPNMLLVSTFVRPSECSFLIKRTLLSCLLAAVIPFSVSLALSMCVCAYGATWRGVSHDNISFNYNFIVTAVLSPSWLRLLHHTIPANC